MDTFDYLVTACWATEKNRRDQFGNRVGYEGQPMTALTGNTFRVYSSVNKIEFGKLDKPQTVFVCAGDYRRWWEFWKR